MSVPDFQMRVTIDRIVWSWLMGFLLAAEMDPDTQVQPMPDMPGRARRALAAAEPVKS